MRYELWLAPVLLAGVVLTAAGCGSQATWETARPEYQTLTSETLSLEDGTNVTASIVSVPAESGDPVRMLVLEHTYPTESGAAIEQVSFTLAGTTGTALLRQTQEADGQTTQIFESGVSTTEAASFVFEFEKAGAGKLSPVTWEAPPSGG